MTAPETVAMQSETNAVSVGSLALLDACVHCEILGPEGPTSDGWWWCRKPGPDYIPGDEMCVEIIMPSEVSGFSVLWRGEAWAGEHFADMEWKKAVSPFSSNVKDEQRP